MNGFARKLVLTQRKKAIRKWPVCAVVKITFLVCFNASCDNFLSNCRVGDVLMSIDDASLEGMTLDDVQALIKNCPRGDVRVVARAAPKHSIEDEADKESVSLSALKEHGQPEQEERSKGKAEENTLPDVLSNSAIPKPRVDMPSELISQGNSDISTAANVIASNQVEDAEQTFKPMILPHENPDAFITTKDCDTVMEDSGLKDTDFDDLPPDIPPPPVPTNDLQMRSSSVTVDGPLVPDTVEDVSLNPPTNFEDFFEDRNINSSPSFRDSEMDGLAQTADAVQLDSQPHFHSPVQKRKESLNETNESYSSVDDAGIPSEDSQPHISIKPPSLFGDDTESIPSALPRTFKKSSTVDDTTSMESVQWNGVDNAPIKPPSLFDDELESLPSLPQAPPPPKPPRLNKQFVSLDTVSSNSSSPIPSSWFDRESPNHASKYSNLSAVSGSSSPSYGNNSTSELAIPFNDAPTESTDVPDDDMSSLPPAPPPPRSRSSTWSVSSDALVSSPHGNEKVPHITSPLSQPVKQERKNSKKRILPLRIRSKRGRKTSEQSESSMLADPHNESLPLSSPMGFGDVNISSGVDQPPEDDMESLPPAPPPPRMSPLTVESLESMADGLQPVNVMQSKSRPSHLASDDQRASTPTGVESWHSPQHSPKKKKSFRRNVFHMNERTSSPKSLSSPNNVPVVPETDLTIESSLTHFSPLEDEVTVTDSSDAMSPPPLPPEMELWSEAGTVEAELALLDQILTLEDSSRSGNEQNSDAGSSSSAKRLSFSKDVPSVDEQSTEMEDEPVAHKSEETFDQRDIIVAKEGFVDTNGDASSLQESPDIEKEETTELEAIKPNSSFNTRDRNEEFGSDSAVNDFQMATTTELAHPELSGKLLKQLSEGHDVTENLVKHRRPAPPVPTRPTVSNNNNANTIPRKSLPGGLGIQVLPSRPDFKSKAAPQHHEPTHKHQKEQQKISSPVKEKTSKKLFSKGHKNKDKRADPNHLESPDASFESNPDGRERSRSWAKKLFGFRSRSKSRDKSKDRENRSRSVSPPRGLFSKPRRSSPTPPPQSAQKASLSQHKNGSKKGPVIEKIEKDFSVHDTAKRPVLLPTVASTLESSNPPFDEGCAVEGNNYQFTSPAIYDEVLSPVVERNVLNDEPNTECVVSPTQVESYNEEPESQNINLNHEEELSQNGEQSEKSSLECEDIEQGAAHFETSLLTRPLPALPPSREQPLDSLASTRNVDWKGQSADEERMPKTSPSKPPVPKKPVFLRSGSTPNTQQQKTVDELKSEFNKGSSYEGRLETASSSKENLQFGNESEDEVYSFDDDDLPSPGPPTFKPVPPPLTLRTSSITDDSDETASSPNSPGPPTFKPLPPPIALNTTLVQNEVNSGKRLDPPGSPGPPRFKPAPPPIDLRMYNKNTDSEQGDLPSTGDVPNAKPLPPIPPAGVIQRRKEEVSLKQNVVQDSYVENDTTSVLQNDKRSKTKPLPPIPTGFNLKSKDNTLSRQNAHEGDSDEDVDRPELLEQASELAHVVIDSTEDSNYSQVSQVAKPLIVQDAVVPVNASHSDDFDSSEVSSEWDDDTCSSTQGDPGLTVVGNRFARSASFSAGDVHIQRPPVAADNKKKRVPTGIMRPPPPMRRRSSSLPQLFPGLVAGAASEGGAEETDYWHTGNLQQLINSRNQDPDVDEGIIEVQVSPTITVLEGAQSRYVQLLWPGTKLT